MAVGDEAVILEVSGQNGINFTCTDGISISKGALLQLSTDLTVLLSVGEDDVYAGVAVADKVAGDGATRIAVHVPGQHNVFDMKVCADGAVTKGHMVMISGINLIKDASDADFELGKVIGQAMEAGSASETIRVIS